MHTTKNNVTMHCLIEQTAKQIRRKKEEKYAILNIVAFIFPW